MKVLGQLPLNIQVRQDLDAGKPTVVAAPDSEIAKSFLDLAEKVSTELYWQGSVIPSEILFREVNNHKKIIKINRTLGHPKCGYFLAKFAYFK